MERSLEFDGYRYATLNFNGVEQEERRHQLEFLELPVGWEVAPDNPDIVQEVIARHRWGTNVLHVMGGNGYCTVNWGNRPGFLLDRKSFHQNGTMYKPDGPNRGVLIRALVADPADTHCASVLSSLWRDAKYSDCMLCCADGKRIPCHRAVLADVSPVFDRMFGTEMREGTEQTVRVTNADSPTVKALIEFAYTGNVSAVGEDLVKLLALADFYQMRSLVKRCAQKTVELINEDNVGAMVRALRPYLADADVEAAFSAVQEALQSKPSLLRAALVSL